MLEATFVHRFYDSYKQYFFLSSGLVSAIISKIIRLQLKEILLQIEDKSFFPSRASHHKRGHLAACIRTEALTAPCADTEKLLTNWPFTEETVYNSDRHVAIIIFFARSDTLAVGEGTYLLHLHSQKAKPFLLFNFMSGACLNNASRNVRNRVYNHNQNKHFFVTRFKVFKILSELFTNKIENTQTPNELILDPFELPKLI